MRQTLQKWTEYEQENTHVASQLKDLRSLGVEPKRTTKLNDEKELDELADNLKQSMLQDYRTAYSGMGQKHEQKLSVRP